jgi:hypothetical protein
LPRNIANFSKFVDQRDPDECWPWLGCTFKTGYPGLNVSGKFRLAKRVAYAIHYGDPGSGEVRQTCHNRGCVNPFHLVLVNK